MTSKKLECLIRLYDQGNRRPLSYNALRKSHIIAELLTNPFNFQAINSLVTERFYEKNDMLPIFTPYVLFVQCIFSKLDNKCKHLCNNALKKNEV